MVEIALIFLFDCATACEITNLEPVNSNVYKGTEYCFKLYYMQLAFCFLLLVFMLSDCNRYISY